MLFKKLKYPLPTYPKGIKETFNGLAFPLAVGEKEELLTAIEETLIELKELSHENDLIDLDLAKQLRDACTKLLEEYEGFTTRQQAFIAAAVRYFVADDDLLSETTFATGFHDDVQILNYVLEQIGLADRAISLDHH